MENWKCKLFGHKPINRNDFFKTSGGETCTAECERCKTKLIGYAKNPIYQPVPQWAYIKIN